MARYIYGGVVLHELPTRDGLLYAVIVYDEPSLSHFAVLLNQPFRVIDSRIVFPAASQYRVYVATLNTDWRESSLIVEDGDANYIALPEGHTFKWCSHTITDINGTIVYTATTPLRAASEPIIIKYPEFGYYLPGDVAKPLVCEAVSPDGGVISYAWYKDGTLVASTSQYTPDISEVGTSHYNCIVTNTLNETTDTIKSNTVRVIVGVKLHGPSLYYGWLIGRKIAELRVPLISHIFDEKNLQLEVIKDDNSLQYQFDQGTFNLDIKEEYY